MKAEHAEEYTQSLGQIVAGGWRQIALGEKLGVPKALGLTTQQWVEQRLGGYVRLSIEERHGAVKELKGDGLPNTKIAEVLGVDEATVRRDSANAEPKALAAAETDDAQGDKSAFAESAPVDAMAALAIGDARDQQTKRQRQPRELPPPPDLPPGEFAILYCDPPWRYEHAPDRSRAVENQYPTLSLDEIQQLPVPAAEDAVLFLWATSPKLAEALTVIEAWGFEYRTCMVWVKDRIGMGYYVRQKHELLLIARRGDMPLPDETALPPSVIEAPRRRHSEKPAEFYEVIERLYPGYEKAELFARSPPRDGWAAWGNEVAA